MLRILPVFICLIALPAIALAQQDPLYGLYLNNPITINPAYTGINNNFTAVAGYRRQWAGFTGSPTTSFFSAQTSLRDNRMGAGFVAVKDQIGAITSTQFTATYSYKINLSQDHTLSFGMQGGLMNYSANASKYYLQDPSDPLFSNISQMKPTLGAGAMLKSERYLIGLSVPRLLNPSFNLGGRATTLYQQQYYLFGAYIFYLSDRIYLKPATLLKVVKGSPLSADFNLNVNIDRNYTLGTFVRNLGSYGFLTQINFLTRYRLAYAFEIPTSKSVGMRYTTNEINLLIQLNAFKFQHTTINNF